MHLRLSVASLLALSTLLPVSPHEARAASPAGYAVWGWGWNGNGELGDGTTVNRLTPVEATGIGVVTGAAGGNNHTLALSSDGTIWAWGSNTSGQLGTCCIPESNACGNDSCVPLQVSGLGGMVAVAAGGFHSLALRADRTVWQWGCDGSVLSCPDPTPDQVTGLTDVTAIAGGGDHSLALRADGTVWTWGGNHFGQLGDGSTGDRSTPVRVNELASVQAIAAGTAHSLALKSDGTVWAWGWNGNGQLGDGTRINRLAPVQVLNLGNISAVSGGGSHSLALRDDGTVWAWGFALYGSEPLRLTPTLVTEVIGAIGVSAGEGHSHVLTSAGQVWSWGWNNEGQLGDGTTLARSIPVEVIGLSGVAALAPLAFSTHSLALAPPANAPPTLDHIGDKIASVGEPIRFIVSATDADGDPLTYSVNGLPPGASFDAQNRTFEWKPSRDQGDRTWEVTFSVHDARGGEDSETMRMRVRPRKIVFLRGIDSWSIDRAAGIGCGPEYEEAGGGKFWPARQHLVAQLPTRLVGEGDVLGFSYSDQWCDFELLRPFYERADTCDGVADAAAILDKMVRRFPDAVYDIVGHSLGGLVAAYWAAGGSASEQFLTDDPQFLRDRLHSVITLDSPLNDTEGIAEIRRKYFWVIGPSRSACAADSQSWNDLQGEDPRVRDTIWRTDPTTGANALTGKVALVHLNSTVIGDLLPGYWRSSTPPCATVPQDVTKHSCMIEEDAQLIDVFRPVGTRLWDDRRDDRYVQSGDWQHEYSPNSSVVLSGGWIQGGAIWSDDARGAFVRFDDVLGSSVRILYSGLGKARVLIDGFDKGILPDQTSCSAYGYGHGARAPGGRGQLCQWEFALGPGAHTIHVWTVPDCPAFVCQNFYLDALELS